jgi:hypothetical protein
MFQLAAASFVLYLLVLLSSFAAKLNRWFPGPKPAAKSLEPVFWKTPTLAFWDLHSVAGRQDMKAGCR